MSRYSPYTNCTLVNYGYGEQLLESSQEIPISTNPKTHVIREGETLASISYQYYGDSGHWGKIALYNNILNPFKEVVPNKQIIIP